MFSDRRHQEILGVILLLFVVILFFSLSSFSITDFSRLAENKPVQNTIGPFGSWLSNFLRTAFGFASYMLCLIFTIAGWYMIRKGGLDDAMERIFSLSFMLITLTALIALVYPEPVAQNSGGYVGFYLVKFLKKFLGNTGAYLVIFIMNMIGLILLGVLSINSLLGDESGARLFSFFSGIYNRITARRKKREAAPFNRIDDDLRKKEKKPPWIEKKRVIVYNGDADPESVIKQGPPVLIEFKELNDAADRPLPIWETNSFREPETMNDFNKNGILDVKDYSVYEIEKNTPETATISSHHEITQDKIIEDIPGEEDDPGRDIEASDTQKAIISNRIKSISSEFIIENAVDVMEKSAAPDSKSDDDPQPRAKIDNKKDNTKKRAGQDPGQQRTFDFEMPELGEPRTVERIFDEIPINKDYIIPTAFLRSSTDVDTESWKSEIIKNSELLVVTLNNFGIESRVINVNRGPVITLYEMQIAPGIKVNRIVGLSDDISMALAGSRVRIVAPIPGKSAIGVEVPNRKREMVMMGDIISTKEYRMQTGHLKVALGKDILGKPVMLDIKKLPHLLIAGATGSGKSVCVNSIITSLIYNYDPNYVRFILVDPKMVELQLYNGIPHLLTPVITEAHAAPKALKWAMYEMERRYRLLSELNTRDIERYNQKITGYGSKYEKLPYILIIMDELADLMMVACKEIEGFITRIAQKARAVGIHLVLATQRPSVDVITGVIKANFPARIAFQVAQKTDSRTIIDQNGAEKLLGKGDMLYQSPMSSFPVRIQGAFISEDEIFAVVQHLTRLGNPKYIDISESIFDEELDEDEEVNEDELFVEALKIVEETKKASASYLQRRLSIGYNRAARIIELMEERGYISAQQGSKPREVFI